VALNIKNPEAEHLARELAKQTGESITEAIRNALKDRLLRVKGRRTARSLLEDVQDILQRVDALPTLDGPECTSCPSTPNKLKLPEPHGECTARVIIPQV